MPEISRFYGIVVKMFVNDHNPPHFYLRETDITKALLQKEVVV